MKKEEKTQLTRQKIILASIKEFGTKTYATASVNSICENGQIPKGLIYHNFQGKDELYLICVKKMYDEMTATLKKQAVEIKDIKGSLQQFLDIRKKFLNENPYYANIFFNAVLQPPTHLSKELLNLRSDFDKYLHDSYITLLKSITLRDNISYDDALEYISIVSEMFNGFFQKKAEQNGDYRDLIEDHEGKLSRLFDFMLYGIAK